MGGQDSFEARIDLHYRFTFKIEEDKIYILTIGSHDEGLGKKLTLLSTPHSILLVDKLGKMW